MEALESDMRQERTENSMTRELKHSKNHLPNFAFENKNQSFYTFGSLDVPSPRSR